MVRARAREFEGLYGVFDNIGEGLRVGGEVN